MEIRICQNCKNNFVIEPDDFGFYEKIKVPPPTFCSECRRQRRSAWRNNMSLYSGKCASCGKSAVTLYSPDSGIVIYCNKCWWSDKWDAKSFGPGYDFSRTFFQQYSELVKKVPHIAMVNDNGIASLNCEYTHDWWFAKNCYMSFSGWHVENVMYSVYMIYGAKDCMDCLNIFDQGSWLYECTNCDKSFRLRNSQFAVACSESHFLYDCRNCTDSFMCAGLRNKKYNFKNVEYSKEEYEKILSGYKLDTFSGRERAQKEYDEFILVYPRRFAYIYHSVNSTGDLLTDSKNSKYCFASLDQENCRYIDNGAKDKDSYDLVLSGELSECYDSVTVDNSQLNLFGIFSVKNQDVRYTQHCHSSKHLFGCIGLRNASYCIFNKQYTKEEYEILVPKIIAQMNEMPYVDKKGCEYRFGEFYPAELSPFGYNETVAQEQYPLLKSALNVEGLRWQDNIQRTIGKETLKTSDIPQTITETSDTITKEIFACIDCGRNYKIVGQELTFYRKMNIPIPHRCFHCRHTARIASRNPFKLWHRQCMCQIENHNHSGTCTNEFETSYAPERPEIIYCEMCYQKEIN